MNIEAILSILSLVVMVLTVVIAVGTGVLLLRAGKYLQIETLHCKTAKVCKVMAIIMILLALVIRSIGVLLCLIGTPLNRKERLYCVIAYLPKATVQAAIGSVPLTLGLPCGNIVLSVAVLSIIMTAPLGAICMDLTYQKLLNH